MNQKPAVVWFRNDLRLADNPALKAAAECGGPIMPVFIWAPEEEGEWAPGAAARWWLHQSLTQLEGALVKLGARLIVRRGGSFDALKELVRQTGARRVFWNRRYEPAIVERDRRVEEQLRTCGCQVGIHEANLLTDPWTVRNKSGRPFQVFTAFWKSCLASMQAPEPLPAPRRLAAFSKPLTLLPLRALDLEPGSNWTSGLAAAWQPGEAGAALLLRRFCATKSAGYRLERDRPDRAGTSRLSPHLHFGEISPRQICQSLAHAAPNTELRDDAWKDCQFFTEIGWREFAHHLLCHFPHIVTQPLRREFERFPWRDDGQRLTAWQRGQTGYPMVDAGMRELWATGWMPNRVRMVVASFLVKDLLIPWQKGARWFWDTLIDADLANNTLGWQWTAGCGADAAPFFRIFNPVSQGEKFDPQALYVRHWVPEIAQLPDRWIHQPWQAPASVRSEAGVELGRSYPFPIADHPTARRKALALFAKFKDGGAI